MKTKQVGMCTYLKFKYLNKYIYISLKYYTLFIFKTFINNE